MPGNPSSAEVGIGPARESEIGAIRAMTRELIEEIRPEGALRPGFDAVYPPERIAEIIEDLPRIHAPPGGGIIVARGADALVGMAMFSAGAGDAAEVRRMYVAPGGRGLGLGRRLLGGVAAAARDAGYAGLTLETGPHLRAAQAFYESEGFARVPPPAGTPPEQADQAVFYARGF